MRYLTFTKLWNISKVLCSYFLSLLLRKSIVWGLPFYAHIENTNFCNLKCIECPTGMGILTRPQGNLSFENFKNHLNLLKNHLVYLVLYFQGEPFLNPELLKMVKYASENRVYTMVSTNGHFFTTEAKVTEIVKSGLGTLVVSLDGISQKSYEKYRKNGNIQKVLEGIKRLSKIKKELKSNFPKIYLQFLVMKHNEHEIKEVKKVGKKLGVDKVLFKTAQIYDFDTAEDILPENLKYRRYVNRNGKYELKGKISNHCFKLWSDVLFTWDGLVLPCCFDKDAKFKMGDLEIKNNKFKQIWRGEKYQKFRNRVLKYREEIPMCSNCTEGVKIFTEKTDVS